MDSQQQADVCLQLFTVRLAGPAAVLADLVRWDMDNRRSFPVVAEALPDPDSDGPRSAVLAKKGVLFCVLFTALPLNSIPS